MPEDSPPPPLPPRHKLWQFSLKQLLIATTAFAFVCGLAATLPLAFSKALIGFIWIAAAGWLLTGGFYARGDQRVFCLGALLAISSMWTRVGGAFVQGVSEVFLLFVGAVELPRAVLAWLDLALVLTAAVINGWLCIKARRYFEAE